MAALRFATLVLCVGLVWPVLARGQLSAVELELRAGLEGRADEMIEMLRAWVNQNTGSWNHAGLEHLAAELETRLRALGFEVKRWPGASPGLPGLRDARTGPLLVGRRPARTGAPDAPRLLLVGHYDTVFELDSPFQRFSADSATGRAHGPGVADMKGGLVVLFHALGALAESGDLDAAQWTVLLNADEEIGSLVSRATIEREARRADYGFVFEAAQRGGAMVRSRRGLGQFHLSVLGTAAHAGSAHDQGRSALIALARKVLEIEALTDYDRGVTLNVGTARAGSKRNIVPERAEAWIDLRYDRPEQGEQMRRALERIARESHLDGTSATLWGKLHRPPKLPSEAVERLLAAHAEVARGLGIGLPEAVHEGGGTDGSLMAGVGLPALDSLGVVGGDAHTSLEYAELASLPQRAALAAILLRRVIGGALPAAPRQGRAREEALGGAPGGG